MRIAFLLSILPSVASAQLQEPFAPAKTFFPGVRVGSRLHGDLRFADGYPDHQLRIRRARLSVDLEPARWVRAELDFDFAQRELKDASVRLRVDRWLRFELGRFRKPFSRIELTNSGRLPLWRRGLVNSVIVEDLAFGDRDVGAAVRGRVEQFRYAVGVYNGSPNTWADTDNGKDVSARFTYRPHDTLRLGVSGGFKYVTRLCERPAPARRDLWAAGVDMRLRLSKVDWVLEALWGMKEGGPRAAGVTTFASVRIPVSPAVEIRPIAKAELLAYRLRANDNLAWSLLAGINVHAGAFVRVLVQGEAVWTQANVDPSVVDEERLLVVRLAFDYRRWFREEEG